MSFSDVVSVLGAPRRPSSILGRHSRAAAKASARRTIPPRDWTRSSDLSRTGIAGRRVSGGLVVKVSDASGDPVQGATVAFTVTVGNGAVNPRIAVTDANGQASAAWTVGTIVGAERSHGERRWRQHADQVRSDRNRRSRRVDLAS